MTRPDKKTTREHYFSLNMEPLIEEAVKETVVYTFNARGEEIESGKEGSDES